MKLCQFFLDENILLLPNLMCLVVDVFAMVKIDGVSGADNYETI